MTKMDKQYIEKEYNAALTEDDLDTARRTMKRLEAIAMQDYGWRHRYAFFCLGSKRPSGLGGWAIQLLGRSPSSDAPA